MQMSACNNVTSDRSNHQIDRCDTSYISLQFLDKNNNVVKTGVVCINLPNVEENDLSVALDKGRTYSPNTTGIFCLKRNYIMSQYRVNRNDTLRAFYFKENFSQTSFELPLSSTTMTIKLKFYPAIGIIH